MAHRSFDSLKKAVLEKAKEGMKKEVLPIVRSTMQKSIREDVYQAYEPIEYQRRYYDGGLIDERNIIGVVDNVRNDGFDFRVENITMPNSIGAPQVYLTPLIVMGQLKAQAVGYPLLYKEYAELHPYGQERDFVSATLNKLDKQTLAYFLEDYFEGKR